jgi:hypothetical protein
LERVREEEGEEGVAASDAGWYTAKYGTVVKPLLALPRSERGTRQVAKGGGRRLKLAYYMRIIRPDTGFRGLDMHPKVGAWVGWRAGRGWRGVVGAQNGAGG